MLCCRYRQRCTHNPGLRLQVTKVRKKEEKLHCQRWSSLTIKARRWETPESLSTDRIFSQAFVWMQLSMHLHEGSINKVQRCHDEYRHALTRVTSTKKPEGSRTAHSPIHHGFSLLTLFFERHSRPLATSRAMCRKSLELSPESSVIELMYECSSSEAVLLTRFEWRNDRRSPSNIYSRTIVGVPVKNKVLREIKSDRPWALKLREA